jgi:hypothetical protein
MEVLKKARALPNVIFYVNIAFKDNEERKTLGQQLLLSFASLESPIEGGAKSMIIYF